ncbi:MAG: hypothetical protein JSS37_04015 [Proteobacteria bacterium]|nr:hypothetical protein [Pseudomonadota bacterium]
MKLIPTNGRPGVSIRVQKQHHMLEAFYTGERVLIVPEPCNNYQTKATGDGSKV